MHTCYMIVLGVSIVVGLYQGWVLDSEGFIDNGDVDHEEDGNPFFITIAHHIFPPNSNSKVYNRM